MKTQHTKVLSRQDVEEAVRTLIMWIGDDPAREDLLETPRRVADAYKEHFSGYELDPAEELKKSFKKLEGYKDMVLLKQIPFVSHCEHHIAPFFGHAHVAYWPRDRIVGLSKLARVVDIFSRRLQTQENMTVFIASAIQDSLDPLGTAILVEAEHQCISMRGVRKSSSITVTSKFLGLFEQDAHMDRFLAAIKS